MEKRGDWGDTVVKIYVEGGGGLEQSCRKGFRTFFEKAGFKGKMPQIVACGSCQSAFERFCFALDNGEKAFLLIDSEEPVATNANPWSHLAQRKDNAWKKPLNATDSQCHLMVQEMENWFLADKKALADFFGKGFQSSALPTIENGVESISKKTVNESLKKATIVSSKGVYGKGAHSFRLLEIIDPVKVTQASPWAKRLIDGLRGEL